MKIRARIFGGDPEAIQFKDATEAVGLRLDYGQDKGKKRLPCISTAYTAFQKLGAERYMEMLQVSLERSAGFIPKRERARDIRFRGSLP